MVYCKGGRKICGSYGMPFLFDCESKTDYERNGRMTLFEASEKYNIPPEIIKDYEMRCLCGKEKNSAGAHQYDDADLENLSIIITLRDMGFTADETEKYMLCKLAGEKDNKLLCMLNKKRNELLNDIHSMETQLQRLDYLRYKLLCGNKKGF